MRSGYFVAWIMKASTRPASTMLQAMLMTRFSRLVFRFAAVINGLVMVLHPIMLERVARIAFYLAAINNPRQCIHGMKTHIHAAPSNL